MSKIELVTVFRGTKQDFIKAIVHIDNVAPVLIAEGWVASVNELADDTPKGDDVEMQIIAAESKDEIEKLIKDLYGVDLDKRSSLDNLKEKALAVINESKRVD